MAQRPAGDPKRRDEFRRMGRQVHDIVGADAFLDALVEVERDERARGQLKANPKAHLQGKGLRIPDEVEVGVSEGSNCIWLCSGWWIWKRCCEACY